MAVAKEAKEFHLHAHLLMKHVFISNLLQLLALPTGGIGGRVSGSAAATGLLPLGEAGEGAGTSVDGLKGGCSCLIGLGGGGIATLGESGHHLGRERVRFVINMVQYGRSWSPGRN